MRIEFRLEARDAGPRAPAAADGRRPPERSRAANSVAWPPCALAHARSAAASLRGATTQRSAPPHSISGSPPEVGVGRGRLDRQAPQRSPVARRREVRVRVVAHRSPERRVVLHRRATQLREGRLDRRRGAGDAHEELRRPTSTWPTAAAAGRPTRSRVGSPRRRRASNTPGRLHARHGQALHRHLGEDAERAHRAGHQARHVEARDVLHHPAAEVQHLAPRRPRRFTPSTWSRTAPA